MNDKFNWKLFFILLAAATVGVIAIVPYSLALQSATAIEAVAAKAGLPVAALLAIQVGQNLILFGVAIWVGLSFAKTVGLGLPILEAKLRGEPVGDKIRSILTISIALGVIAALLIIALDVFVFQPALKATIPSAAAAFASPAAKPAAWKGFLASFYGGIDEEILLRLCVMSFLVWVGRFVGKTADGKPTPAVFWAANVVAAVLFGLGHLPATSLLLPLTPLVVLRAIVLNGLGGVAFGWLYWKRGLESAMLSHFSADLVLHVLFAI